MIDRDATQYCDQCDHNYQKGETCIGKAMPCQACCTNAEGKFIYVPEYVIYEMCL